MAIILKLSHVLGTYLFMVSCKIPAPHFVQILSETISWYASRRVLHGSSFLHHFLLEIRRFSLYHDDWRNV